jgi:hypothetical protein
MFELKCNLSFANGFVCILHNNDLLLSTGWNFGLKDWVDETLLSILDIEVWLSGTDIGGANSEDVWRVSLVKL